MADLLWCKGFRQLSISHLHHVSKGTRKKKCDCFQISDPALRFIERPDINDPEVQDLNRDSYYDDTDNQMLSLNDVLM